MGGKSLSAVHMTENGCLNYTRNSNSKHQENTVNVILLHCSGNCNSFWLWTVDLRRIKHPTRRPHHSGNDKDIMPVWTPDSQKVIWSQSVHLFLVGFFFNLQNFCYHQVMKKGVVTDSKCLCSFLHPVYV